MHIKGHCVFVEVSAWGNAELQTVLPALSLGRKNVGGQALCVSLSKLGLVSNRYRCVAGARSSLFSTVPLAECKQGRCSLAVPLLCWADASCHCCACPSCHVVAVARTHVPLPLSLLFLGKIEENLQVQSELSLWSFLGKFSLAGRFFPPRKRTVGHLSRIFVCWSPRQHGTRQSIILSAPCF